MAISPGLFDEHRTTLAEAIELTAQSLREYAKRYRHWVIAFSGGKDSGATVTIVSHLIETGSIPAPDSLTVLYADTRMEMPPLQASALQILSELEQQEIKTQVVLPALDDRFFVYMFGRGIPPPKNRFRWCTAQIKIEPMLNALSDHAVALGFGEMVWDEEKQRNKYRGFGKDKLLMITGVRLGESAQRDARIVMSCSRDGAECGQGWFQEATPEAIADTLAPLLHWRVCHVWAWLTAHAPAEGYSTRQIATVYGGEEAEEINARTGCVGCPLASRDTALQRIIRQPDWAYLAPLTRLKPLYTELTDTRAYRLRKHGETKKDGSQVANPGRLGPLTMDARRYGLGVVLGVQEEINAAARQLGRPEISLIDEQELARIEELIAANTWPEKWSGDEHRGDELLDKLFPGGAVQPLLGGL